MMKGKHTRSLYQAQSAPKQALSAAVAQYSATKIRRPVYAIPVVAASLLLALWVAAPMQEHAVTPSGSGLNDAVVLPGLASLSLPNRPTMPNLAQVNVPRGHLAIPRINQISITQVQRENHQ